MKPPELPPGLYWPSYRDKKTGEQLWSTKAIWCKYSRGGKVSRVSTETTKARTAVRFRARCIGGDRPVTTEMQRASFEDLAGLVTKNYDLKGFRSSKRIKQALAHLRAFFTFDLARDIGTDRLHAYVEFRRAEKASNATINRELSALRKGFRLAAQADPPKVDRVPHFELLKEANARKGFFEREDFDRVHSHLAHYLKVPILVAYVTGWRLASEILTRQKSHLNLQLGTLRLDPNESKNAEGREFPVNAIPELREALDRQLEKTRALELKLGRVIPLLFHHNGKPIKNYDRAWKAACVAAKVSRLVHDCRRTAARNLIRAGVPTQIAKKVTGHKTDSIFNRYAIIDQGMIDDAAAKLAQVLAADQKRPAKVVAIGGEA
jgi:site-specific recombinase XerD